MGQAGWRKGEEGGGRQGCPLAARALNSFYISPHKRRAHSSCSLTTPAIYYIHILRPAYAPVAPYRPLAIAVLLDIRADCDTSHELAREGNPSTHNRKSSSIHGVAIDHGMSICVAGATSCALWPRRAAASASSHGHQIACEQ